MNTYEKQFKLVAWLLVLINAAGITLNYLVSVITFFMMGVGLPILAAFFIYLSWALASMPSNTTSIKVCCAILITYYSVISFFGILIDAEGWFIEIDLRDGLCMPGIFPLMDIILLVIMLTTINTQPKIYEKQIH